MWSAWTPREVSRRLAAVTAPWCVAAGGALELFTNSAARTHEDLEISVPAVRFDEIVDALPGYMWDVAGNGRLWPYPQQSNQHVQTWLREPATGIYRLDVFREPSAADHWICRRDATITMPYSELILRTGDGIPFLIPEVALLFKAKHSRPKDHTDFSHVLPTLPPNRQARLRNWLSQLHPGHPWINALDAHK